MSEAQKTYKTTPEILAAGDYCMVIDQAVSQFLQTPVWKRRPKIEDLIALLKEKSLARSALSQTIYRVYPELTGRSYIQTNQYVEPI